jgi:hypothetical protein
VPGGGGATEPVARRRVERKKPPSGRTRGWIQRPRRSSDESADCGGSTRVGGSAERRREAIPRALASGEAGEAYAQHRPGRWLGDRGELKVARAGREHNAAVLLRSHERHEETRVRRIVDVAEVRIELGSEHLADQRTRPVGAGVERDGVGRRRVVVVGEPQTMVKASPDPLNVTWPPSMFHQEWAVSLRP